MRVPWSERGWVSTWNDPMLVAQLSSQAQTNLLDDPGALPPEESNGEPSGSSWLFEQGVAARISRSLLPAGGEGKPGRGVAVASVPLLLLDGHEDVTLVRWLRGRGAEPCQERWRDDDADDVFACEREPMSTDARHGG